MKNSVRRLATRAFSLSILFLGLPLCANQEWLYNYEDALKIAQREGKPIFADFWTTWCHNCKQLDKETLSDPSIASRLDEFVKVKIDGDQHPEIVQRYRVDAYPTLVTIDPNGQIVDKVVGYVKPRQLAGALDQQKQILAPALAQMKAAQAAAELEKAEKTTSRNGKPAASNDSSQRELATAKSPQPSRGPQLSNTLLPIDEDLPPNTGRSKPVISRTNEAKVLQQPTQVVTAESNNRGTDHRAAIKQVSSGPREIAPLLSRARNGSPGGGEPDDKDPITISQAAPRKAPDSAITDEAPDEELPRPLLKTGNRGNATPAKATQESAKTAPVHNTENPTSNKEESTPNATTPVKEDRTEEDDLSTIRKLQGSSKNGAASGKAASSAKSSEVASKSPSKSKSAQDASGRSDSAADSEASADHEESKPSSNKSATDSQSPTRIASKANADEENSIQGEITADDIERWIKDADSKLIAGHKREARAMYAKVYEKDPSNKFGHSDMAFVKMVSLMVDEDDDAKRRMAHNKIKEFEAHFPNSEHKDYYTLIRATLAADLGDTNSAHRLLETFADRFPNSKYQELAYETWKSLPPVKKESPTKQVAKDSGSKKSSTAAKSKKSSN